jgi:hypothetical protein
VTRPTDVKVGYHPTVIEREILEQLFATMRANGVETNQDLLWGYFFTDPDASRLRAAVPDLERAGYRFVDILAPDDEPGHVLHVERIETHTIDSLDQRNRELDEFAQSHGLESYDGMDVGRVDGQPFGAN